jgi:hypothetical protein
LNENRVCSSSARESVSMRITSLRAWYRERDSARKEERSYLYMIVESLISTEASLRVTCVLFLESHFSSLKIIFCSFNEHTQMSDYVTKAASFENIHSCCSLHSIVIDSVLIHLCQDSLKIYKKSRLDIISLQLDNISISVCSRHICSE